jgi:hypothetical protein
MDCLLKTLLALLAAFLNAACTCGLAAEPRTWTVDDFEDGDTRAASGWHWIVIADDLIGGASEVKLEVAKDGARRALRLAGRLDGSRSWAFAGAWVPLDRAGGMVSLAGFEGVRLSVKGSGKIQVGFRTMTNFMAEVEAGPEWRQVEVPFRSLAPQGKVPEGTQWTGEGVTAFGVTTAQLPGDSGRSEGDVSFEIDDVVLYGKAAGKGPPSPSGSPNGLGIAPFAPLASIPTAGWIDLGDDPARDGNMPALPDAMRLEAIPASADGMLWVRVTLREPPHGRWMGINLVLDTDGDPANGQPWWGANKGFNYDRVVTAWCWAVEGGCQGFIGLADAAQAAAGSFVAGGQRDLRLAIDRERRAFIVGVPRSDLRLGSAPVRLVAAVGSALLFADDVPGQGAASLR